MEVSRPAAGPLRDRCVSTFNAPSPTTPYPTMWFPAALRVSDATVLEVSDNRPETIDLRLPEALTAVRISGRVVDERGEAVRGASVALYDDDDRHALVSWKDQVAHATSDQTGGFNLTGFSGRRSRPSDDGEARRRTDPRWLPLPCRRRLRV